MFDYQKLMLLLLIQCDPQLDGIKYSEIQDFLWLKDGKYIEYANHNKTYFVTIKGIETITKGLKAINSN